MTSVTPGENHAADSKAQKYPINSHCVKVGAVGPFVLTARYGTGSGSELAPPILRDAPGRYRFLYHAAIFIVNEFFIQLLII
jgi:hypothetical protein